MPVERRSLKEEDFDIKPPKSLNWARRGLVSPVQDQELCGSCWSFSALGAIEGQIFKNTGQLVKLSEQYLIDCNRDEDVGNYGCL